MDVVRTIVNASRPVGWCFGPILYGIGAVHGKGLTRASPVTLLLQSLSLSFPLALILFGVNDVYDYDTDLRNPRKTADGLEGIVLSPSLHAPVLLSAWIATLCILLCFGLEKNAQHLVVSLFLLLLSWGYSTPPLRFKECPVLDSLSNGTIVLLTYLSGYIARGGSVYNAPTKGLVLGLCAAGVHALGAAMDAEADAAAGQRTIATALGPRGAVAFAAAAYLLALSAERKLSIFGVYLAGGLALMSLPLADISLAHGAFRAITCWTCGMSMLWFAEKALSSIRRRTVQTKAQSS
ncbi:hypothetical protein BD413DRAFT_612620 [Trametes elegans]|nr:hypothetical protein BD413DRAFT_612620 [Trametes elegans]